MNVKVNIVFKQKNIKLPTGIRLLIRKACNATLQYEQFAGPAEVDVTVVNDDMIKEMNSQFRNIDSATDVLSFPLGSDGNYDINPETNAKMLGDIVISQDKVFEQAESYGHSVRREFAFLIAHSMLHLCGYDHMNPEEAARMEEKQEQILQKLGITRDPQ